MNKEDIPNPWSVQIELTEGCNRRCYMCGIHSIRGKERNWKFMKEETAKKIAEELEEWIPQGRRIEFGMHGEPSLNPNINNIFKDFRDIYPNSQILTYNNGITLSRELIEEQFDAGLNILIVDIYDKETKQKVEELIKDPLPAEVEPFESGFHPWKYHSNDIKKICLIDNLLDKTWNMSIKRRYNNMGNNTPIKVQKKLGVYLEEPLVKDCSNVHRELIVKYDGFVPGCCMDWQRLLPMGKFPEESLKEIWQGDKFQALRQMLYNKHRVMEPCCYCNHLGFRNGLNKNPNFSDDVIYMLKLIKKRTKECKKWF